MAYIIAFWKVFITFALINWKRAPALGADMHYLFRARCFARCIIILQPKRDSNENKGHHNVGIPLAGNPTNRNCTGYQITLLVRYM